MSALLENLRYDGSATTNQVTAASDELSSEGKFGIPRFSGEATQLPEYVFRVKMRMEKEKNMAEEEIKKLGPLGLRLVEGLRGQALRLAQHLKPDELASEKGPEFLLKQFTDNLKPRASQEARELYSAGSKEGGLLSRQPGEPMSSYVTRRKTWWICLQDLDATISVPEVLLAEQMLANSGISHDQKLMVRTMLQGVLTIPKVSEELLAQHPRIHEGERRGAGFKGGKSGGKFFRRFKGFHGDGVPETWSSEADCDDWSVYASEYDNASEYPADSAYEAVPEYDMNMEDMYLEENLTYLTETGLDLESDEACALAAETLQLEYEAYNLRQHAKGKGHGGFQNQKQFDIAGHISIQEKRARLQQLKSRTECRRCGQRGHWSGDPQCPKGGGKRSTKGKGSSSAASSTKGGKPPKQRIVYFGLKEDIAGSGPSESNAFMAVRDDSDVEAVAAGVRIPPPASLGTPPRAVSQPQQSSRSPPPIDGFLSQWTGSNIPPEFMQEQRGQVVTEEDRDRAMLREALGHLSHMDVDEEFVHVMSVGYEAPEISFEVAHGLGEGPHVHGSLPQPAGLPEVYPMTPTLPIRDQPEQWATSSMSMPTLPQPAMQQQALPQPALPQPATISQQEYPQSTTAIKTCAHRNTTRRGTNKYYDMLTCTDCGSVLSKTPREPAGEKTSTSIRNSLPAGLPVGDPKCLHYRISWKGSNGFQSRKTCLDCGQVTVGMPMGTMATHQHSSSRATSSNNASPGREPELGPEQTFTAQEVGSVFEVCGRIAGMRGGSDGISLSMLHKILDSAALALPVFRGLPLKSEDAQEEPEAPQKTSKTKAVAAKDFTSRHTKIIKFGRYRYRNYAVAYQDDGYVNWVLDESIRSTTASKEFLDLASYFRERRSVDTNLARSFMAVQEPAEVVCKEDHLIAVLDSGCNKTCHGEQWLVKYMESLGLDSVPLSQDDLGSFKGIGGKVEVNGTRHLNVSFELDEGGMAIGDIDSMELKGSSAPLLLSIMDQRKLGLVLDLGPEIPDYVYSKTLKANLKVASLNGLMGVRLLPAHLAMMSHLDFDSAGMESSTLDFVVEPCPEESPKRSLDFDQGFHEIEPEEENFGEFHENFMPLDEQKCHKMNKQQKKHFQQDLSEVQAQDQAMWTALYAQPRPRQLPRGCKTFLLEIFAGAAMLTSMALDLGYAVSTPVDLVLDGSNMLNPETRKKLDLEIERDDPYIITLAPICGPWGPWSRLNMSKSVSTAEKIQAEREQWYPAIRWISQLIRRRLAKGRKVLMENPWPSEIWSTLPMDKLISEQPCDQETGEPLQLIRGDQCQFGLTDEANGHLHYKPTGFLTASKSVKEHLHQLCPRDHYHSPLEGGQKTKRSQAWPPELCRAMLDGFIEELTDRSLRAAFAGDYEDEVVMEDNPMGELDAIYDDKDLAPFPTVGAQVPDAELLRQEAIEEHPQLQDGTSMEAERREKWLRASRSVRGALRRLHAMTGHCSNSSMIQLLRTAKAPASTIQAARHFACETCRKTQQAFRPNVVKIPSAQSQTFNFEVGLDAFETKDAMGNRVTVLSCVCLGTLFHQAWIVSESGGVPKSSRCAQAFLQGWIQWAGAPTHCLVDRGVHNRGHFASMLQAYGIKLRFAALESPFQHGRTERQGGLLKTLIKSVVEEKQVIGVQGMQMVLSEVITVKNNRLHHSGFTPSQWVLGRLPREVCSLTHEDSEDFLGVHQGVDCPMDQFAMQLQIRQAAKEAFTQADASQKVRSALLRKSTPMRGPYQIGDLVSFIRKGKWYGPGRIIGREGRSNFWIVHSGIPMIVSDTQIRPATRSEVLAKQILELRPSRKRRREDLDDLLPHDEFHLPFHDDLVVPSLQRPTQDQEGEDQPSYVEIPVDEMETPVILDQHAAVPPLQETEVEAAITPQPPDPVVPLQEDDFLDVFEEGETLPMLEEDNDVQPEEETSPVHELPEPPVPGYENVVISAPPGLGARNRSRSPLRDPSLIHVPEDDGLLARQRHRFDAFLAKRYNKKKRQVGAGHEIKYDKSDETVQKHLDASIQKEWTNWKQFQAIEVLKPEDQEEYFRNNPDAQIIPTRWVHVNKAEDHEEPKYKSRLVARGDLETDPKSQNVRTDSPTCSLLFMNMIISFAVCNGYWLNSGDISAAFLQGVAMVRRLLLSLPTGGLPDPNIPQGSLLIATKSVYGTKDAPRSFWKRLREILLECGLKPLPGETAAYYLHGPSGEIAGLLGSHVDDLLWAGGPAMQDVMTQVQTKFKFGKIEDNKGVQVLWTNSHSR